MSFINSNRGAPPGAALLHSADRKKWTGPLVTKRAWIVEDIRKHWDPDKNTMMIRLQNAPRPRPEALVVRVDMGWNGLTYGAHPADNRDDLSLGPGIPVDGGMAQPPWNVQIVTWPEGIISPYWYELLDSVWVPNSFFSIGHCYEPDAPKDCSEELNHELFLAASRGVQFEAEMPPGMMYVQKQTILVPPCTFRGRGRRQSVFFLADRIDQPVNGDPFVSPSLAHVMALGWTDNKVFTGSLAAPGQTVTAALSFDISNIVLVVSGIGGGNTGSILFETTEDNAVWTPIELQQGGLDFTETDVNGTFRATPAPDAAIAFRVRASGDYSGTAAAISITVSAPNFRATVSTEIVDVGVLGNRAHQVYQRGLHAVAVGGHDDIIDIPQDQPNSMALRRMLIAGSGGYGYQLSGDGIKRDVVVEDMELRGCDTDGVDYKDREEQNIRISFSGCKHFHWSNGSQGTHLAPLVELPPNSVFTVNGSKKFGIVRANLTPGNINDNPHVGEIGTFVDGGTVNGIPLTGTNFLATAFLTMGTPAVNMVEFEAVEMERRNVNITIATPAVVSWDGPAVLMNQPVRILTNGQLPDGLEEGDYYAKSAGTSFEISLTPGGASINTTGAQTGTHTMQRGWEATATAATGTGPAFNVYMPHWADGDVAFDMRGADNRNDFGYCEGRLVGHGAFRVRPTSIHFPDAIAPVNNVLNGCMARDVTDRYTLKYAPTLSDGVAFSVQGDGCQLINPVFQGAGGSGIGLQVTSASFGLQLMSPKFTDGAIGLRLAGQGINIVGGQIGNMKRKHVEVHGAAASILKTLGPNPFTPTDLGKATVRVEDIGHGLTAGENLEFHLLNDPANGLTIERSNLPGSSTILTVEDEDHYIIVARRNGAKNVTITSANPAVVNWPNIPGSIAEGTQIVLDNTNLGLPAPIVRDSVYFVRNPVGNTFNISTLLGGALVNTTGGVSTGVHFAIEVPPGGIGELAALSTAVFGGDDNTLNAGLGGLPVAVYPADKDNVAKDIHIVGMRTYHDDPDNTCIAYSLGVDSAGSDFGQADTITVSDCHDNGTKTKHQSYATNLVWGPGNTGGIPNGPATDHPIDWVDVETVDLTNLFRYDFQNIDYPDIQLVIENAPHSAAGTIQYIFAPSADNCINRRVDSGEIIRTGDNTSGNGSLQFNVATGATASGVLEWNNFNQYQRTWFSAFHSVNNSGTGVPLLGGFCEARAKFDLTAEAGSSLDTLIVTHADGTTTNLIDSVVPFNTSVTQTATDIVTEVNSIAGLAYFATRTGGRISIVSRRPLMLGDVEVVSYTATGALALKPKPTMEIREQKFNAISIFTSGGVWTGGTARLRRRG